MAMEPHIIARLGVGVTACVLQLQALLFRRLYIEQPVLIVVERGSKRLRWAQGEYCIGEGDAIAIAGGQYVDITNRPAADGGYAARWLVCDDALIAAYADQHPQQMAIREALPILQPAQAFAESFQRASTAIADDNIPPEIARHHTSEMLLWIGMHGGRFAPQLVQTLGARVRRLISHNLSLEWSADTVASQLAMSVSTLRRKLAEEQTGLRELLLDARMSCALTLLQASNTPVTQIALSVGYQTPSHFAARFRQRFGFAPTAVRQRADIDFCTR